MSEQPFNPSRPWWDKGTPGTPSTLTDLDDHRKELSRQEVIAAMPPEDRLNYLDSIQVEATSLANSAGAKFMLPEQQFLASWQVNARVAAASLNSFRNPNNLVENRNDRIKEQQYALAVNLYRLGQIDSALAVAAPFPALVAHITWIAAAIQHEDDLTHDCPRESASVEIAGKDVDGVADRRVEEEVVFSARHGYLVHVWVCSICGEANATAEIPERQQRYTPALHRAIDKAFQEGDGKSLDGFRRLLTE